MDKKKMNELKRMKVVIIGGGLGGLSCGAILSKNGYEVTVLEKNAVIGGCLQCFRRAGKKFETGMHFVGSVDEGQTLSKLMRYLEIDDVPLQPLDDEAYDVVSLNGNRYRFAKGRKAFVDGLAASFPSQRENLERYFDLLSSVANASALHTMTDSLGDPPLKAEYQLRSVDEVISSVISDPLLQKVLVGCLPLYAGVKGKTPFSTHAFIVDFYNQSACRVVGGSDAFAASLERTIKRYGGKVLAGKEAIAIEFDGNLAKSVVIGGQEAIRADVVISCIHPRRTMELLDTKFIRPAFRQRLTALPNTVSCFVVYVDFKEQAMPYMNSNFYGYRYDTPWDCEKYDESTWPKGYLYVHMCDKKGQRYASAGEIISYMWPDDVAKWFGTKRGRRGEDYEAFKQQKAELLIDCVEREFPGFRNAIKQYYTSTPLTYMDYTGTAGGSMYGVAKDITLGAGGRVPHKTKIPNLYMAGQNVNSHGMLGVLVGTIVACSELIPSKTLYTRINENG